MRTLNGRELARMRSTADRSLSGEGEVWRRYPASDGAGGQTITLSRVSTGPWRIAPITTVTATEAAFGGRLGGAQGWWATAQYHVDIALTDQLRMGGRVFEVVSVDFGRSDAISARVLCKEVT